MIYIPNLSYDELAAHSVLESFYKNRCLFYLRDSTNKQQVEKLCLSRGYKLMPDRDMYYVDKV